MALREQFVETVTAPMGVSGDLIPVPDVATTIFNVNPDGTEGSMATAYADRVSPTVAPTLVTDAAGQITYWLDPGEYNIHFDDTQIPPRIPSFIRGFASIPFTTSALVSSIQPLPIGTALVYSGEGDPIDSDSVVRWMIMDGRAINRLDFPDYFALLNSLTTPLPFGTGDGSTTFNIPDMRQRFPLAERASGGTGSGAAVGETGGAIDHDHSIPGLTIPGLTIPALSIPLGTAHATVTAHTHPLSGNGGARIAPIVGSGNMEIYYFLGSQRVNGSDSIAASSGAGSAAGPFTGSWDAEAPALVGATDSSGAQSAALAGSLSTGTGGFTGTGAHTGTDDTGNQNPPYLTINFVVKVL